MILLYNMIYNNHTGRETNRLIILFASSVLLFFLCIGKAWNMGALRSRRVPFIRSLILTCEAAAGLQGCRAAGAREEAEGIAGCGACGGQCGVARVARACSSSYPYSPTASRVPHSSRTPATDARSRSAAATECGDALKSSPAQRSDGGHGSGVAAGRKGRSTEWASGRAHSPVRSRSSRSPPMVSCKSVLMAPRAGVALNASRAASFRRKIGAAAGQPFRTSRCALAQTKQTRLQPLTATEESLGRQPSDWSLCTGSAWTIGGTVAASPGGAQTATSRLPRGARRRVGRDQRRPPSRLQRASLSSVYTQSVQRSRGPWTEGRARSARSRPTALSTLY